MKKAENHTLNCMKGIACILVVLIHFNIPGMFGQAIAYFGAIAVPVFFLISGYYSGNQDDKGWSRKILKKAVRIAKLFLGAFVLYFLLWFIRYGVEGRELPDISKFLLRNDFSDISAYHLWFLPALFYCYISHYVLYKVFKKVPVYAILIATLICQFIKVPTGELQYVYLIIAPGFMMYYTGKLIKDKNITVRNIPCAIFLSGVLSIVFVFLRCMGVKSNVVDLLIYGAAIGAFICAENMPNIGRDTVLEHIGRDLSLYVYVLHFLISILMDMVTYRLGVGYPSWWLAVKPLALIIACLITSEVIFRVKKKLKNKKDKKEVINESI